MTIYAELADLAREQHQRAIEHTRAGRPELAQVRHEVANDIERVLTRDPDEIREDSP